MARNRTRSGRLPRRVEPAAAVSPERAQVYAALDLGTNSCRMLIARPRGGQIQVIDSFSRSVQLGARLERSRVLSREGTERTIAALRICRAKFERFGVVRKRLVATEACRRARNADAFLRRVQRETGLELEVISPEEEARLAVVSCAPLLAAETSQALIVDIGGGSTELVWIDLSHVPQSQRRRAIMRLHRGFDTAPHGQRDGQPVARVVDWISVPLGVATLRDQFRDVQNGPARFALMSCHFEEFLSDFLPYRQDLLRAGEKFQIIGTSGTVTTVAASHLRLRHYDRSRVDGLRMTSDQVEQVIAHYLRLGSDGRRRDPCIGRDRLALIMPGSAILQALLRIWPTDHLSVADRGLREGLLYGQMSEDGALEFGEI